MSDASVGVLVIDIDLHFSAGLHVEGQRSVVSIGDADVLLIEQRWG